MRPLRVSAISFLNTAPLMWDFQGGRPPALVEGKQGCPLKPDSGLSGVLSPSSLVSPADGDSDGHRALASDFDVTYTVPSRCAEQLKAGEVDIGIIPAITYALIPNLVIVPDVAIASKRAVRSILLVSKVPLEEIRTVATDSSSRTSVALLKVLFEKYWGGGREFTTMKPDVGAMLATCDAGLLIGDPALQVDRSRYLTIDLAEEWNRFTGKPFVFAVWAMRMDALNQSRPELDVAKVFQLSRDRGIQPEHIAQIAREWSPRLSLSELDVTSYLTENIDYFLDSDNLAGLALFYRYAAECGIIPEIPQLRFLISGSGLEAFRTLEADRLAPVR